MCSYMVQCRAIDRLGKDGEYWPSKLSDNRFASHRLGTYEFGVRFGGADPPI